LIPVGWKATVTLLVPADRRDRANGLVGAVQGIAFMVTSVFSGLSVGLLGMGWTVVIAIVATAIAHARRAGLDKIVHFEKRDIDRLEPTSGNAPGTLVINPPYGERLGEESELEQLYEHLGDLFKQRMKGWTGHIFTGNPTLAKRVGLRASQRIELWNGPIECRLLRYELY